MISKDIKTSMVLLMLAIVLGFAFNTLSPNGIAIIGQWEKSRGVVSAGSKSSTIEHTIEITDPAKALAIAENPEWVVLDVREADFFEFGHIPGAASFPLSQFDQNLSRFLRTYNKDQNIMIYCSSAECTMSHEFAHRLQQLNYLNVKVFSGGFQLWQEMGYDIITK
jgi:rhodanese-related sulfurtransferase